MIRFGLSVIALILIMNLGFPFAESWTPTTALADCSQVTCGDVNRDGEQDYGCGA